MSERENGGVLAGIGSALTGIAILLAQFAMFVVIAGTSIGAVREHCLDVGESEALQRVEVDTGWTYMLWPPLVFASLDPAGRCVRNSPLREGLAYIGLWELPSAEEQVREHVLDQLRERRATP
jgi:hypothetical protein